MMYLFSDHYIGPATGLDLAIDDAHSVLIEGWRGGAYVKAFCQVKFERVTAESRGSAPKVMRESAENTELPLWPAGGAESLRLPS